MTQSIKGWIGRLALIGIGLVFLAAGGLKALDPEAFAEQVTGYGIIPASFSQIVVYTLLPFEVALGIALIVGYRRKLVIAAAVVMLVGFIGLLSYTWATGGDVSNCGCFGRFAERSPLETMAEDVAFIGLALVGLLAPAVTTGKRLRAGAVAASALATLAFLPMAPELPLDDIVTGLKSGMPIEDLGVALPDAAFSSGRHLVAILSLEQEESGPVVDAMSEMAAGEGAPGMAVLYADSEEVKDAFFWMHAPPYPMYQVAGNEMRALYRRLPRFFMVEDGQVTSVWDSLPEAKTLMASAGTQNQEI
jgi:uncharacterized membrane protein YphA (DoxX/SURF4 family)